MEEDNDIYLDIQSEDMKHINIGIIQEENLVKYTDDHFVNKLNRDLALIRSSMLAQSSSNSNRIPNYPMKTDFIDESNSPISISIENSDNEADENYFDEEYGVFTNDSQNVSHSNPLSKCFKKLSFQQVKHSLDKYYDNEDKFSSELDILTTYVKGQKHLFLKAKSITQRKLNILMFPCLLCTAGISIFAPIFNNWIYNGILVSVLNAFATFLISVVHYLRLEGSCEMFSNLAVQYDKIECALEMTGNKLYITENLSDKTQMIMNKMSEIEKKMNEIKETNTIFIPDELRPIFPIICHINIFSFIKRIEIYKKNLIIKFRDIKNEIRYIQWKFSSCENQLENMNSKEKKRFEYLCSVKEKIKNELLYYRNAYAHIDELFIKEIKNAENISFFSIFYGYNKATMIKTTYDNPVITDYLNIIFAE